MVESRGADVTGTYGVSLVTKTGVPSDSRGSVCRETSYLLDIGVPVKTDTFFFFNESIQCFCS